MKRFLDYITEQEKDEQHTVDRVGDGYGDPHDGYRGERRVTHLDREAKWTTDEEQPMDMAVSQFRDRQRRNEKNNPFRLYPDFGDAEPSAHRARDARDRGLKNLEKRQAKILPVETLSQTFADRKLGKATNARIESGKMRPSVWTVTSKENKDRPHDTYGFTDIEDPSKKQSK